MFSLLVGGAKDVGKSSLRSQYLQHVFPGQKVNAKYSHSEELGGNITLFNLFQCNDTRLLNYFFFDDTEGLVVVFDLTNRASFSNLGAWSEKINKHGKAGLVKVRVLVGNKCDLTDQRVISREEAEQAAASLGMRYFETTATDHDSTREAFREVVRAVVEAQEAAMTPVHRAASSGDVTGLELAVHDHAADIDLADPFGWTAMHHAVKNGHVSTIEALVRLGSKAIDTLTNRVDAKRLHNTSKNGWTPMLIAVHFGYVNVIKTLVRLGSKTIDTPDRFGRTPLYFAVEAGNVKVIESLIQSGSNIIDSPNNNGCTPIYQAASKNLVSVIETLVRLGSTTIDLPNNDHNVPTPMHVAALNGHVTAIEKLIELGSKAIDLPSNDGKTPLFVAASNGHVSVIELLVRLGSNAIDTPDNDGLTPLYTAAFKGHVSVIEALVRLGSKAINRLPFFRLAPRSARVLKAVGVTHDSLADIHVEEDEVVQVRYRVHFSRSLVNQLLYALHSP